MKYACMIVLLLAGVGCISEVGDTDVEQNIGVGENTDVWAEETDVAGATASLAVSASGCKVKGFGFLGDKTLVLGRASQIEGEAARGFWVHIGPRVKDGKRRYRRTTFFGRADEVRCQQNGAVLADVFGSGKFNGRRGFRFRVAVQDLEPPTPDFYSFFVFDENDEIVFFTDGTIDPGEISTELTQ